MAHFVTWLVLTNIVVYSLAATTSCGAVPNPSAPARYICGGHGELRSPVPLERAFTVLDEQSCADTCEITPHCASFGYFAKTKNNCHLYSKALRKQDYIQRKQDLGVKFSHWRCFKCTSDCNIRNPAYARLKAQDPASATAFCSSYLGYPSLTTEIVSTTTVATETSTSTLPDPTTTTSTTTTTTSTTTSLTSTTTTDIRTFTTSTSTTSTTYTYGGAKVKRAGAAERTSAACSCFVDPSTSTVTNTDTSTTTTTTGEIAGPTNTVTSTVTTTTSTLTTTTKVSTSTSSTSTTTTTVVVVPTSKPAICNAKGLPGSKAFNYDADFNSNPAKCIAGCKADGRCLSTGAYYVTDPSTGTQTYTCRRYVGSVTDSADLGFGYYNFNDKACP